jgi:hypothetical protein
MSQDFAFAKVGGSGGAADLIFVHGLTGNMVTTWECSVCDEPSGNYWPKWLCEDLTSLNVYTLGYPTSLFESWAKREMSLYERAKAVHQINTDARRELRNFVQYARNMLIPALVREDLDLAPSGDFIDASF